LLLVTAHVKVCHLAYDISKPYRYSFLEILAADICFVNLFRSILPIVPTECDVLIVGNIMTIIVHFTIEHQVYYDWKFKEQHAKIWENIVGAKRYSCPRGFNIAGVSTPIAPSIPTPLETKQEEQDLRVYSMYACTDSIFTYNIHCQQSVPRCCFIFATGIANYMQNI